MTELGTAPAHPVHNVVDYELLFDCVHCGLCLEACPTYIVTRAEMDSPRGRIYLMKSLAEGRLELDDDAVRHFDLCLGCRGCETACPSGVHYGRLIEDARAYVEMHHRRTILDRLRRGFISAIFPYPSRLRAMLAPLALAERLHLRRAIEAILPQAMREWVQLLPPLARSKRSARKVVERAVSDAPTVVVHHGCVAQVLADSENTNSERLLNAAGYRVLRLQNTVCCGALDLHAGNGARARSFARENVRALKHLAPDAIISAASGCSAAIAEHGAILKDDPALAADARDIQSKVRDLSSLLLEWMPKFRELRCTVTWHDACHLVHGLGVRDNPRKLLQSIPGVQLIELAESDLCCGSAGSYNLTEPQMARTLVGRKADNVLATGADYVVLSNPGCEFQIAAELKRRGAKTKVIHLADFLVMALDESSPS
ncbi:MAG TPA: heterodisulfide reductase-related iron-sulfur binding cluster [Candidatus Binataceae bacterium]|nr:heterodisulfide reductase-related iron-sulfur binding cluster [Candidatus Binataceae bacterium]